MDGLFLVYLMGICGSPGPTPVADRVFPVVVGIESSPRTSSEAMNVGGLVAERPVPPAPVEERPAEGPPSGGNLSKAEVVELVRRKSSEIRHCYELGLLEDANYGGTVEVGWKIDLGGHVVSANLVSATQRNPAAEECLLAAVRRWEFHPSSEPIVIGSYPFTFDGALLSRHPGHASPKLSN